MLAELIFSPFADHLWSPHDRVELNMDPSTVTEYVDEKISVVRWLGEKVCARSWCRFDIPGPSAGESLV
jgi:hypothetical protein